MFSVNASSGSARLLDSNARGLRLVLDSHGSSALAAREHQPRSVTAAAKRTRFRGRWRVSSDADANFKDGTTGDRSRTRAALAFSSPPPVESPLSWSFADSGHLVHRSATGEKAGQSIVDRQDPVYASGLVVTGTLRWSKMEIGHAHASFSPHLARVKCVCWTSVDNPVWGL